MPSYPYIDMRKIIAIGELLIDFMPNEKGLAFKKVSGFTKSAGGAPANVCVAAAKLGSHTYFLGQVGDDGFGHFLKESLNEYHVNTNYLTMTKEANTALAFVTLSDEGEREFIFYRNPSADQLYDAKKLELNILDNSIFHFCSVSLLGYEIAKTHDRLIEEAKKRGAIISFDPNIRLSLSNDHKHYQDVVRKHLDKADILKISDDELEFITGEKDEQKQMTFLFKLKTHLLIITRGKSGVSLYLNETRFDVAGFSVDVVDTTGAGDAWIGSLLSQVSNHKNLSDIGLKDLIDYATFSNAFAALITMNKGAIQAMPSKIKTQSFMDAYKN